jgi:hypothetical protein
MSAVNVPTLDIEKANVEQKKSLNKIGASFKARCYSNCGGPLPICLFPRCAPAIGAACSSPHRAPLPTRAAEDDERPRRARPRPR